MLPSEFCPLSGTLYSPKTRSPPEASACFHFQYPVKAIFSGRLTSPTSNALSSVLPAVVTLMIP
uniref:Uncharacterized protein MANES_09G126200 n=1 Tax=Rhizophora mucronata TaxID=61149 RepID=A0A2P2KHS3_RHIMU